MENILSKLFDLKKIPTKFIFVVWASCCIILFVPKQFLSILQLTDFLDEFGKYIGILFIISSGFLLVAIMTFVFNMLRHKRIRKNFTKQIINSINQLDDYEKAVLREFFLQGKHILQLPIHDESVVSLTSKGILYQHSNSNVGVFFDMRLFYSIHEIALDNLTEQMIDMPTNHEITKKEGQWLLENRPEWNRVY